MITPATIDEEGEITRGSCHHHNIFIHHKCRHPAAGCRVGYIRRPGHVGVTIFASGHWQCRQLDWGHTKGLIDAHTIQQRRVQRRVGAVRNVLRRPKIKIIH